VSVGLSGERDDRRAVASQIISYHHIIIIIIIMTSNNTYAPYFEEYDFMSASSSTSNSSDDDYYEDFGYFTDAQYIVLFVVGLISCLLSICGSSIILYLVIRGKKWGELYHRLLVGLSVSDLILSFCLILQPIFLPAETGYIFAIGNTTTCAIVGFGYLFFIASYTYNCMLGVYFLATVRYQIPQATISKWLEPHGHLLAFAMPIAIGTSAAFFGLLNPNPFLGVCSLSPTNHECEWRDDIAVEETSIITTSNSMTNSNSTRNATTAPTPIPTISGEQQTEDGVALVPVCENQDQYLILNSVLDYYALTMVVIGLICTIFVYWTVKRRYRATGPTNTNCNDNNTLSDTTPPSCNRSISSVVTQHGNNNVDGNNTYESSGGDAEEDEAAATHHRNEAQTRRIQEIARQAVWYAVAYMAGLLIVLAANIIDGVYMDENDPDTSLEDLGQQPLYYTIIFLIWLVFPLQGFFNGIIYIRPRLVRWKHHYEDASWWFAFCMVLSNETPPSWGAPTVSLYAKNSCQGWMSDDDHHGRDNVPGLAVGDARSATHQREQQQRLVTSQQRIGRPLAPESSSRTNESTNPQSEG
jgi:hypothetical protein